MTCNFFVLLGLVTNIVKNFSLVVFVISGTHQQFKIAKHNEALKTFVFSQQYVFTLKSL